MRRIYFSVNNTFNAFTRGFAKPEAISLARPFVGTAFRDTRGWADSYAPICTPEIKKKALK